MSLALLFHLNSSLVSAKGISQIHKVKVKLRGHLLIRNEVGNEECFWISSKCNAKIFSHLDIAMLSIQLTLPQATNCIQ